ncbi:hypothetical protein ES703_81325 [subsurface metagenome]
MGFIRGILLILVIVLLFLSLFLGNVFLTLNLSLDYENVQPKLVSAIKDVIEKEINLIGGIEEEFEFMKPHCQNNSKFVFSYSEYTFEIPCEVVDEGLEAVIDYQINSFVEEIYYKDYECDFWDCIGETEYPFFLVSAKAKDYWGEKFYFSLIASVIFIALIFFLVEHKTNLPILVGSLLTISALPFIKLDWILSFINKYILGFLTIFFTKAHTVFLIGLISGIVIFGIGIILKFFNLFDKFGKKKEDKASKNKKE